MVYELRTYWAAPGKAEALHNRFRHLTLDLFKRHQMEVVAFWTPTEPNDDTGDLVYLMRFSDQAAGLEAWNTFRNDPDWVAGKAATEVDGSLTSKVTSTYLEPTDYSPLT